VRRTAAWAALVVAAGAIAAARLFAAQTPSPPAEVPPATEHRVWVTDRLWQHSALFDGDTGAMLGTVDGSSVTVTPKLPLHAHQRGEIYSVDVAFSRGRRGDRTDYVTIYDAKTLSVTGEIVLPTRTSDSNTAIAYSAMLDGEHYLAAFNQFPLASVSIVDLEQHRFVGAVAITGCAGIYPVGKERFATLCGDGTIGVVTLDRSGNGRMTSHTERFFDPIEDPVTLAGVRSGDRWVFVSFEGYAHVVDFATDPPTVQPRWSLFTDEQRADHWRVGGLQHLALHTGMQRLYSLVHKGERGSHKAPGGEVWVYDLATQQRVDRFALPHFMSAFMAPRMGVTAGGFLHRAMQHWIPTEGAHTLAVTQDAQPLLFVRNAEVGVVAVLDGRTGEHLRNLDEAGIAGPTLGVD
jgi:methylamine dehydrogenase heavy chain